MHDAIIIIIIVVVPACHATPRRSTSDAVLRG